MDALELLKNKQYSEIKELLPFWVFNTQTEKSFRIENIIKEYSIKTGVENIYIITATYKSKAIYWSGWCDDPWEYGYEYGGSKQVKSTCKTNINSFSFDNLELDVELTDKQKKALINFKQVITIMSKKEACSILSKLIDGARTKKNSRKNSYTYDDCDYSDFDFPDVGII